MSLAALKKVRELVEPGRRSWDPSRSGTASLTGYPDCDAEFKRIADELWGQRPRVIEGKSAKEVLAGLGVAPDFEAPADADLDYIHRRDGDAEIYFVSNPRGQAGARRRAVPRRRQAAGTVGRRDGRTWPGRRLSPGRRPHRRAAGAAAVRSLFVVFRTTIRGERRRAAVTSNFPAVAVASRSWHGPWSVGSTPSGAVRRTVDFDRLEDWTLRPEDGHQVSTAARQPIARRSPRPTMPKRTLYSTWAW